MFVKVKVLKAHAYSGKNRAVDDEYSARQGHAKILKALGKVAIIDGTETKTPSFKPFVKPVEVEQTKVTTPAVDPVVPAVDETPDPDADETSNDETHEEEKTDGKVQTPLAEVADEKPAPKRKGKYATKVMTAKK